MGKLNLAVWAVSLALQSALLLVLVRRSIARRLPVFAVLIAFYVIRSGALFVVSRAFNQISYSQLASGLAALDVGLQCLVAWELYPAVEKHVRRRIPLFLGMIVAAGSSAWGMARVVPGNPRAPMDRSVVFTAALFLFLFAVAGFKAAAPLFYRVRAGFAVYGLAAVSGQVGLTLAAAHRDSSGFVRWSYVETIAYLGVVVWWLVALPGIGVYASTWRPPAGAGSRSTGSTVAPAS